MKGTKEDIEAREVLTRMREVASVLDGLVDRRVTAIVRLKDGPAKKRHIAESLALIDALKIVTTLRAELARGEATRKRVERATKRAAEVMGTPLKGARWMTRESQYLNGLTPCTVAATASGLKRVMEELGRIEHGAFA